MRSQQISSRLSLLVSLLFIINLSVFMWSNIPVHASSQSYTVAKMQPDLSFQKDLDVLSGHPEKSDSSSDSSNDDYFGLHNDNPPEPKNPSYREYNLNGDIRDTIFLVHGSRTEGSDINLPHLTDNDLSKLVINDGITIDKHSKLQQNDLQSFSYNPQSHKLTVDLNSDALKKTNGAGTQLILNLTSQDGKRYDQAVIGLWRNYVEHPYFELNIGNNLYLQYMLNNDSTYSGPRPSTVLQTAIPNYRIRDSKESKIVDTMYWGGDIAFHSLYDNLFIRFKKYNDNNEFYGLKPTNHIYVGTDPNVGTDPKKPGKIIFQFDATLQGWYNDGTPRIRVMGCLEPTKNGQEVITKQKLINYSTKDYRGQKVKFSNTEFFRDYDTDLDNKDWIPIRIGEIDRASGRPKGIYFKDVKNNDDNDDEQVMPYRLDFLFDKSDSFPEFGAFKYIYDINIMSTMDSSKNVNTAGYRSDDCIFNPNNDHHMDSSIGMLRPFKTKNWDFGTSTPTMSYGVTSSAASAPHIQNVRFADADKEKNKLNKYVHDPDKENPLPAIPLKGQVNSTNEKCSEVKLYYSIDPKDPKDLTKFKYLTKVEINQHEVNSWADFPREACITNIDTNTKNLQTLATPSKNGHTIYIYGLDENKERSYKSNVVSVNVQPNVRVTLCYKDQNGKNISSDKSLIAAEGDTLKYTLDTYYKNPEKEYLPKSIMTQDGSVYSLVADNKQPDFTRPISQDNKPINICYRKTGTITITAVPQLDFGDVLLPTHKKLIPMKKQKDPLVITDEKGDTKWQLTMAATPFYRVDPQSGKEIKDDKNKLDSLLTYQYANKAAITLESNKSPVLISSYNDPEVPAATQIQQTQEGTIKTTNFQNIWWNGEQQIEGPMLLPPKNYSFKNKAHQVKYQSTVTWTLNNSL